MNSPQVFGIFFQMFLMIIFVYGVYYFYKKQNG